MRGRKTKYTPETVKKITDALRIGCVRKVAYGVAGIHADTFCDWMNKKSEFSEAVTRAEDEAEQRYTGVMAQAAQPHDVFETITTIDAKGGTKTVETRRREFDWRAAESWLKRRRRIDWGDSIDVRKLDDDTLLRLLGLTERSDTEGPAITDAEYAREG